jgi:hypothetical protein
MWVSRSFGALTQPRTLITRAQFNMVMAKELGSYETRLACVHTVPTDNITASSTETKVWLATFLL